MIIELISIFIKNYIEIIFFDTLLEAKDSRNSCKFYMFLATVSIFFGTLLHYFNLPTFISSIVSLIVILSFQFFYNGKNSQKILYALLLIVLIVSAEFMSGLILLAINISIKIFTSESLYIAIQILLTSLLLFLCVLIIKFIKRKSLPISNNILFIFYPITSIIIIYSFHWVLTNNIDETISYLVFICISILIIISNLILVHLIKIIMKNELNTQKLKFAKKNLSMNKQHQNDLIESQKNIKKLKHDLKSDFLHISGLLNAKKYDTCKEILSDLLENISALESIINTGYNGLDAVLSSKIIAAKSKQISITPTITLPSENFMYIDEFDISMICANILDNAIEATEQCHQKDTTIEFQISYDTHLSHVKICCQNPTLNQVIPKETTKKNKINHGFGLKTIKNLAEKWDGMMHCDITNDIFTIIVILYNH